MIRGGRNVLPDEYISKRCNVNIGLYYDMPVLIIERTASEQFVYLTLTDWEIIRENLPVFQAFMKGKECPSIDYSENIVFHLIS